MDALLRRAPRRPAAPETVRDRPSAHAVPGGAAITSGPQSLALQASTAAAEEAAVAELLLGQVVMPIDHLVEELARRPPCGAVNEVAFVAVLAATGVKTAGPDVQVGD